MASKEKLNKIVLEVDISERDYGVLAKASKNGDIASLIKALSAQSLHEFANGGLMLTGEDVARLSAQCGVKVSNSEDVINAVEKVNKVHNGNQVFEVEIDPSIVENLKTSAEFQGMSMEEYIQMQWNHILANGWLSGAMPDVFWVPLNQDNMAKIKAATGREVISSGDVVKALDDIRPLEDKAGN